MCCRYWMEESPELRPIVEEMKRSTLIRKWLQTTGIKSEGEIRPTDVGPVIAPNRYGNRTVYPMRWGFSGRSLLLNARSETAASKPTFKEAWERHRCIVPASWYFEWCRARTASASSSRTAHEMEHLTGSDGKIYTGDKYMIQPKGDTMTSTRSGSHIKMGNGSWLPDTKMLSLPKWP